MVRVVNVARGVGALLITGGALTFALAVVSAIRHPSLPLPWMNAVVGLFGGALAGGMLLVSASRLNRGRVWAFYAITGIAATGTIWSGISVLSLNLRAGAALPLMLALSTACAIAWPQAQGLRKREPYAPLKPIPSTGVIVPPPPARLNDQQLQP